MTTPAQIAELRALLAKATPGTWRMWAMDVYAGPPDSSELADSKLILTSFGTTNDPEPRLCTFDISLICALHNHAPAMLDEIEALRAENERLRKALEKIAKTSEHLDRFTAVVDSQLSHKKAWRDAADIARTALPPPTGAKP